MVHVLVNFLQLTVLAKQPPEHTHPPHPKDLGRKPCFPGTLALTISRVTSLSLSLLHNMCTRARVDVGWLPDDETILDQLSYVLARVGHGDLADFIGVEPDLAVTALEDTGGEPLLELERNHRRRLTSFLVFWQLP
ncbi:hypothetical protein C1H46_009802 [Malus baccata]|uniref:Uncharacterized protein n=1 Tax=Malus baccata TaxID=106549 RepID=A0A540N0T7_MALBA|nr:hypothetical protein C1H46_009802 [Malus baccata]